MLYEFQCLHCAKRFVVEQSLKEYERHPGDKCPKCGCAKVRRIYSAVTVTTAKKS